jgi:CRISPR-associated endonuclease/helicase Cas3
MEKGFDINKQTHPEKTFLQHVNECKALVKHLAELYGFPKELVKLSLLLCETHDIGKLFPEWGLSQQKRPLHALESAEWILENLNEYMNSYLTQILAYAIITHHSSLLTLDSIKEHVEKGESINPRHFIRYTKCRPLYNPMSQNNFLVILKKMNKIDRINIADMMGIFKIADVISAKNIDRDEVIKQYKWPEVLDSKIITGIREKALKKRGVFDEAKYEEQSKIASSPTRNLIVAAPTGWGKTALALMRTIALKPMKIFYVLPTITAIKDLYETFTTIINEDYVGEYFYFADVELLGKAGRNEDDVIDFYRYFLPKITITTIDQILLTMLQVGRYHTRRFNFRNSLLIIDEYHLLTPQMMAVLRFIMKDLAKFYNISFLLMSATPSPIYKRLLTTVLGNTTDLTLLSEYEKLKRHRIEYYENEKIEKYVMNNIENLGEQRTLILVNTVQKAQAIYKMLKDEYKVDKKIVLIHGDYAYKDRASKEKEISQADILVSTQVAEVSLDVSFDLLLTELAPIPSLIQRLGRVNRYGFEPKRTNAIIFKPNDYLPYDPIQLSYASKYLPSIISSLELEGEKAYLKEEFWQYEEPYIEDIVRLEEKISSKIEKDMLNFFSFVSREEKITEFLGRDETWLAVPKIYLEDALSLYRRLKDANYTERKSIYSRLKSYLAPASYNDVRNSEWSDELGLPIITNYISELGIIRIE